MSARAFSFINPAAAGLMVLLLLLQLEHLKDFDNSSSDLMFGMWHLGWKSNGQLEHSTNLVPCTG